MLIKIVFKEFLLVQIGKIYFLEKEFLKSIIISIKIKNILGLPHDSF